MTVPLVKPQNRVGSRTAEINEKGMVVRRKKDEEYFL